MKRTFWALALAAALYAVAVSPAGAGTTATAPTARFCDPLARPDLAYFGGAANLRSIAGRGGDDREPDLGTLATDLPASAKGKAGKRFKATVPVYFHVVTDGAIGRLTDAQIATQIAVLNNTFAGG